jgi:arginyl-tRNA synthetase
MFPQFRDAAADALADALADLGHATDDLGLEEPPADVDAILASSVAFRLAEAAGAPPPRIAAEVADAIESSAHDLFDAVVAQGPYVNFEPSDAYYAGTLAAADGAYGRRPDRDESVVVEHTSANPTGPIHVGRARNPIVGDALASLLDYAGYDVDRHYYVNDAGRQVATLVWAVDRFDGASLPDPERDRPDYDLVRYYRAADDFLSGEPVAGDEPPDDEAVAEAEAAITATLQRLEEGDPETLDRVEDVTERMLDGMRATLDRLPARFDRFVRETGFMRDGSTDDVVERLKSLDAAERDGTAWQLDLDGIDKPLVFLRGDGTSLYTTRDLAHHEWKLDNYDRAVTVLGEDHELQARQVRATLDRLGHDPDRVETVHYSWVTLPEGGMSTRAGTGIDLDDLLDEAIDRARSEVDDRLDDRRRDDDLDADDVDRIAEGVGVGAVRFAIVATQASKGITFEWERALDFEAQSAPYVQYVHARCCGILAEAAAAGHEPPETVAPETVAAGLETAAARDLVETVARFQAVIDDAAADRAPHRVATYVRGLAESFNRFYRSCPVLDASGPTRAARLACVAATRHTVANALDVLGIDALESM